MQQTLFREEALEARRNGWLGGICLTQPMSSWVLVIAATAATLAILLFLFVGSYTKRSKVSGRLVPIQGLATVEAPADGVIRRVVLSEGNRVSVGDAVAVVVVPRATPSGGDTAAALEARLRIREGGLQTSRSAQRQVLGVQSDGVVAQLESARREVAQVEAEILIRQRQSKIARETFGRLRELQQAQYVSDLQAKQQEAQVLELDAQVLVLERQAIAARRLVSQLQQSQSELPGQRMTMEAGYQRDLAQLEQERLETEARGQLVLVSPATGMVATRFIKAGQSVKKGQPILSVLPGDGSLEAELLVPSSAIGFIRAGDQVRLRYQAYPYQKFGHQRGAVVSISRSALASGEPDATPGASLYRVTVALARQSVVAYGRAEPLKPGMLLEADIFGEKRRLIEWVLDPLHSVAGM